MTADQIIRQAVDKYRSSTGWEGDLLAAVDELEYIGLPAWPALEALAASLAPEVEYFVRLIMTMPGVSEERRAAAIKCLAANDDCGVQSRFEELRAELSISSAH